MQLAPPVVGGQVISRQGCRHLARYTLEELRPIDVERCAQDEIRRWHNGLDIGAPEGTPILAPWPGTIRRVYQLGGFYDPAHDAGSGGYGRSILVEHWPGCFGYYAHCLWTRDDVGAVVARGEQLGAVGGTCGSSDDPTCTFGAKHLHLEFVRRWPLRSDQVEQRYDVVATLEGMGIVESRGRFYWREQLAPQLIRGGAEGPFPAEGIAPGQSMLISESATSAEPVSPSGDSASLFWIAGAWWILRRRRQQT